MDVADAVAHASSADDTEVQMAVERAFVALHLRYVRGDEVPDIPAWATRHALTVISERKHGVQSLP